MKHLQTNNPTQLQKKAVFLDRDGVINADTGYVYKLEDLVLCENAPEGLLKLKDMGFLLIVISNQSGIERGFFTTQDVEVFNAGIQKQLQHVTGERLIDEFYFCPHLNEECNCRKPKTGMIDLAVAKFNIDLKHSLLIGDKESDIECAINAGIVGIQIVSDNYKKTLKTPHHAKDLLEAAGKIKQLKPKFINLQS